MEATERRPSFLQALVEELTSTAVPRTPMSATVRHPSSLDWTPLALRLLLLAEGPTRVEILRHLRWDDVALTQLLRALRTWPEDGKRSLQFCMMQWLSPSSFPRAATTTFRLRGADEPAPTLQRMPSTVAAADIGDPADIDDILNGWFEPSLTTRQPTEATEATTSSSALDDLAAGAAAVADEDADAGATLPPWNPELDLQIALQQLRGTQRF